MKIPTKLEAVTNYEKTNENLSIGGVIADCQAVVNAGFKSVIDLRRPEEGVEEEKQAFAKLNINYVNIPVTGSPTPQQLAEFKTQYANLPQPVLIHCKGGGRVRRTLELAKE